MATKKKDHIGFRNGNLFCFHCGTSQVMPLPMEAGLAGGFVLLFSKHHKKCTETWKEPDIADAGPLSYEEKKKWWIVNGEHGISSKTIFSVIGGVYIIPRRDFCHPCDPNDFYRCYKLLKAIPEWIESLHLLSSLSFEWKNLVDNWSKLTSLLEEQITTGKSNGMYDLMQELITAPNVQGSDTTDS